MKKGKLAASSALPARTSLRSDQCCDKRFRMGPWTSAIINPIAAKYTPISESDQWMPVAAYTGNAT